MVFAAVHLCTTVEEMDAAIRELPRLRRLKMVGLLDVEIGRRMVEGLPAFRD